MRNKYLFFIFWSSILWGLCFLSSCENTNSPLGLEIQPENSVVKVHTTNFEMEAQTVAFDLSSAQSSDGYHSLLVSSPYSYLGSLPDKYFKTTSCEYLCQFYIPAGFKFSEEPVGHKIDSTRISLYYTSFSGDSIAPITLGAYRASKTIPFADYSITDISPYGPYTMLGETSILPSYGSSRFTTSDGGFVRIISIPVSNQLGQEIYDKSRAGDPIFSSQEAFNKFFPAVYLKTNAGTGAIMHVMETALSMYYTRPDTLTSSSGQKDSIIWVAHKQELRLTPEVPQLMRFQHENLKSLLEKPHTEDEVFYSNIKSPAGVVTELIFPTSKIYELLSAAPAGYERKLISAPFSILADPGQAGIYDLPIPENLLLLPKDSVASFFENNETEITEAETTYLSQLYSQASTNYSFSNIVSLLSKHIEKHPHTDLKVWVLPVSRSSQNLRSELTTTRLTNLLKPTGLKIKYTKDSRKLNLIYHERKKSVISRAKTAS